MSWRERAAPIIRQVIASEPENLRKALRDAYPFGARKMWPYKIWCDEIRRQLGKKQPLGTRTKPFPVDDVSGDLFT